MGFNMCLRLQEKGYQCLAWNRGVEGRRRAKRAKISVFDNLPSLFNCLPSGKRVIWLMVGASAVDEVLERVLPLLSKGDIVIDGGNSFFQDTIRREKILRKKGIKFLDIGVSGGPAGARRGACLMVGGDRKIYKRILPLIKAAAAPKAYAYLGSTGAGHFVKMVHNGIEYGMMQAIAEGFAILKKSPFNLDLRRVAELYNNQSVIASRLTDWLVRAYKKFGTDLTGVSSVVAHTGEGAWTVKTAKQFNLPAKIIEESLKFRKRSFNHPSYEGKILSALRHQFGGHAVN